MKPYPAMVAVALLSGCTVGPSFTPPAAPSSSAYTPVAPPAEIPATASTPGEALAMGAELPARWWTQFGNPALNRLVDMALAANTDVAIADANLRQARAQAAAAAGSRLPEADIGYQASRTRASESLSDPLSEPGVFLYGLHTTTLNISYPLDLFGGARRRVESARATAEASAFRLEAARAAVAANTVLAAIEEAALREKIAATEASIKASREVLALLRVQQDAGAIGKADVAAQVAVLAQAEGALPALIKALGHQRSALSILLGREPAEPLPATPDLDTLALPATLPVSLPSLLVRQRPDVRAAEASLHAASADVGVAIAARLPSISLSASAGGQASRFGDMFRGGNPFWSLIGGITQPLFHGGALRQQQRAAEAALDGAKAQYRAAVLGAFGDVADALTALHADAAALAAAEKADGAAAENLGYLAYQLRLGQVGTLALLNATATRSQTAIALVDARATRFGDVAALYLALGGSTQDARQEEDAMGGVIGAIGAKFVIAATGLLVSASIEGHRLQARIDPGSESSTVSARIADQVDGRGAPHGAGGVLRRGRPMTIAMSGGTFPVEALAVAPSRPEAGGDFRIGRDILEGHVFDLDFRSRQIRMVLPYEYARATRRLIAVDLTPGPDGSWTFPASVGGKPVAATLRLSDPRGATIGLPSSANGGAPLVLAVGTTTLSISDVVRAAPADARAPVVLGLGAFDGRRVMLDLPHRLFWIDPRGSRAGGETGRSHRIRSGA